MAFKSKEVVVLRKCKHYGSRIQMDKVTPAGKAAGGIKYKFPDSTPSKLSIPRAYAEYLTKLLPDVFEEFKADEIPQVRIAPEPTP